MSLHTQILRGLFALPLLTLALFALASRTATMAAPLSPRLAQAEAVLVLALKRGCAREAPPPRRLALSSVPSDLGLRLLRVTDCQRLSDAPAEPARVPLRA